MKALAMMKLIFISLTLQLNPLSFCLGCTSFLLLSFSALPQPILILDPQTDFFSFSLVSLTTWLTILMVLASLKMDHLKTLTGLLKAILISLALSFFSGTTILFYFWFEVSLIPIFWLILGWGYQPERFLAGMVMVFYTLMSSFPLLMSLLFIWNSSFSMSILAGASDMISPPSSWLSLAVVAAFLVKFPMYSVHLWLPKAHVEAPVSGSMILAGVLLKLGGYGIYRLASIFLISSINTWMMLISGVGGVVLGALCCRVQDMKVLIAYSSVVHMAFIILALMGMEGAGVAGVWWVMLGHGLVSSGLFASANFMYEQTHSRSILINKGCLSFNPPLAASWFILLMMNFSGPFTLNLYGEINLIFSIISTSKVFTGLVFLIVFLSASYSLILYASTQQGSPMAATRQTMGSPAREMLITWSHIWPSIILLGNLSI